MRSFAYCVLAAVFLLSVALAHGAEPQVGEMQADRAALEKRFGQRLYSPWAESGFPRQVYWGDTHLHTGSGCFALCRIAGQGAGKARTFFLSACLADWWVHRAYC